MTDEDLLRECLQRLTEWGNAEGDDHCNCGRFYAYGAQQIGRLDMPPPCFWCEQRETVRKLKERLG